MLAGVMVLGLVACSPTDPEPTDTSTPEVTEPADTSEPEQTAPAEPDDQEPQETAETTANAETEVVEPAETPVEAEPTYSFTSVNETVYRIFTASTMGVGGEPWEWMGGREGESLDKWDGL